MALRPRDENQDLKLALRILSRASDGWTALPAEARAVFARAKKATDARKAAALERLHRVTTEWRRLVFAIGESHFNLVIERAARKQDPRQQNQDEGALALLIASDVLRGARSVGAAKRALRGVRWDQVARYELRLRDVTDPVTRFGIRYSLPNWAAQALLEDYGDEAPAIAMALEELPPRALRTNTLKTTRAKLARLLRENSLPSTKGVYNKQTLTLPPFAAVFAAPCWRDGWFEAMDEGSQIAATMVAPPPGGSVLDLCAGSGGKTLAIAAELEGKGRILAADVRKRELEDLKRRARRAGAHQVQTVYLPPAPEGDDRDTAPWPAEVTAFAKTADRIVIDAPCTGLGAFRRHPAMRWTITEEDVARFPQKQLTLLRRSTQLMKEGARVIYITCTLRRQENEDVIRQILTEDPSLEIVPIKEIHGADETRALTDPAGRFLKLRPDLHGTDGFFTAVLRKKRSRSESPAKS